jgi:uncharacterized protein
MDTTQRSREVVQMDELVDDVCWRLLSQAPIARIAFDDEHGVQILPVNIALLAHLVVFRTSEGSMLDSLTSGTPVVVEVDEVDATRQTGWSVIVRGRAERLDRDLLPLVANAVHPWADGERDRWFWVRPERITGRAISRPSAASLRLPYMAPD